MLSLCVLLNQIPLNALFTETWIVSSNGTEAIVITKTNNNHIECSVDRKKTNKGLLPLYQSHADLMIWTTEINDR